MLLTRPPGWTHDDDADAGLDQIMKPFVSIMLLGCLVTTLKGPASPHISTGHRASGETGLLYPQAVVMLWARGNLAVSK